MTTDSPRIGIHVAATFIAIDPEGGSESGNGWNWLEQIAPRVSKVTAVVPPEVALRLRAEAHLPANVTVAAPDGIERVRTHLPLPSYYLDYAGYHEAMSNVVRDLDADLCHQVTLATPYWGTELETARGRRVLGPVGVSRPAPIWATRFLGASDIAMEWARRGLTRYPRPPVSAAAALGAADHVLAVDAGTARRATRLGKQVTRMMADGAHPVGETHLEGVDSRTDLVWAGRLMPRKGCVASISAFAQARNRLPAGVRLIIVGDGPERPDVERAVSENRLANHVELAGQIPRAELLQLIGGARALVFSSLRDTFGGVVLEAAERATPTVWSSHPGVDGLRAWYPEAAGWSRPARSGNQFIDALAQGMIDACTATDQDWSERAQAAYDFALEHDWDRRGDAVADLYRNLVRSEPK